MFYPFLNISCVIAVILNFQFWVAKEISVELWRVPREMTFEKISDTLTNGHIRAKKIFSFVNVRQEEEEEEEDRMRNHNSNVYCKATRILQRKLTIMKLGTERCVNYNKWLAHQSHLNHLANTMKRNLIFDICFSCW